MIRTALLFFIAAAATLAAQFELPPNRQPAPGTWQNAGVRGSVYGGIPERPVFTTLYSTNDSRDRTAEINRAIVTCPPDHAVQLGPGEFHCRGLVKLPQNFPQRTLRGSVDETGTPLTTLVLAAPGSSGIALGTGHAFTYPASGIRVAVGGLTKGATRLELSSTAGLFGGQLLKLRVGDEGITPIFHVSGVTNSSRVQMVRIASVLDATHIAIDAPGCIGDYSAAPFARLFHVANDDGNFTGKGLGLEDVVIQCVNTPADKDKPLRVEACYGSWIKNVVLQDFRRQALYLADSLNCEIRDSHLAGGNQSAGPNQGGIVCASATNCLIENNLITETFPHIEMFGSNTGNVVGYNFLFSTFAGGSLNSNHAPFNQFQLYEGNVARNLQCDGYFGGTAWDAVFRNWFFGRPVDEPSSGFVLSLNRFTRYYSVVGNILGKTGVGTAGYSFGNPNLGNQGAAGTAQPSAGRWWKDWDPPRGRPKTWSVRLAEILSDTAGVLTVGSGQGRELLQHKLAAVAGGGSAYIRLQFETGHIPDVIVGTIIDDAIAFTQANRPLPPRGAAGLAFPGPAGFQEIDLDVEATTLRAANYLGGDINRIPAEELAAGSLPDSLYLEHKPAWFHGLKWPPFDPHFPPAVAAASYAAIPAGHLHHVGTLPRRASLAPPTVSPPGGSYGSAQRVTLTARPANALIRYTVDGTTPSETHGILYTGPLTLDATTTLRAVAFRPGLASSQVRTATFEFGPPTPPSHLSATAISPWGVLLEWTDNSANETHFVIYRGRTPHSLTPVGTAGANFPLYLDLNLTPNTTYFYAVRAASAGAESAPSPIAAVSTRWIAWLTYPGSLDTGTATAETAFVR